MAASEVQGAGSRAARSLDDYIPDDFGDFGALFTDDEQARPGSGPPPRNGGPSRADGTEGLGIDEEVSVKKRVREPRVKLNESLLLSKNGIPALRQRARCLKLKGKGHEFSDASRLLSLYQLWLDDLFPKARFADALVMVEKEGHKASMHKMRMEWINESKPKDEEAREDDNNAAQLDMPTDQTVPRQQPPASLPTNDHYDEDLFDEDLYDASPLRPGPGSQLPGAMAFAAEEVPDESELDALMADAVEMHGDMQQGQSRPPPRQPPPTDEFDGLDDLDALMAEAEAAT